VKLRQQSSPRGPEVKAMDLSNYTLDEFLAWISMAMLLTREYFKNLIEFGSGTKFDVRQTKTIHKEIKELENKEIGPSSPPNLLGVSTKRKKTTRSQHLRWGWNQHQIIGIISKEILFLKIISISSTTIY
jgi:hypothetical protein